jgi:hypothetical protein
VIEWAQRKLGRRIDWWQARTLRRVLRHDRFGHLIHRTALFSTARQNGKSVVVRTFYGWLLDEGHDHVPFSHWAELIAAAHDAKQARLLYSAVYRDLLTIPEIANENKPGQMGARDIRLTEHFGITIRGLLLDTVTGQPGSARGHAAGAIAWDEVLTQTDWEGYAALSPTQIAQVSPILLMTSTAGFEDSLVLRSFYDRLVRIATGDEKPDDTFYGAWWQSDNPEAGMDWRQIKQANPSLGDRLSRAAVASEYALIPTPSWKRERLNHWVDSREANSAFKPGVWAACRIREPLEDNEGPFALGIGVAPGWERATIAVAALRADGRIGVEVYRDLREDVTPEKVTAAVDAFGHERWAQTIAYDASSGGAGAFERHGQEAGLAYDGLKPGAMVAATMDVSEMVMAARLAVDDPLLDFQLPGVVKRPVGADGAFRFSRGNSLGPIDAIEAMTLAAHAIAFTNLPGLH